MTRLLIQVHGEPDRTAIVEDGQAAGKLFVEWARTRYAQGKPLGGAIYERVVRCRCGQWVPWLHQTCEACREFDWRSDERERTKFETHMLAKTSGE